jgi:anti-sigma factor RsiW
MTRTWPEFAHAGNDNAVAEDDLQAYVDGQLDSRRRAAIESYLAANPRDAERLAAYRTQNIGLHALLDPRPGSPLKDDKLPPRIAALAGALQAQLGEPQPRVAASRRLRNLAASVALLAAAGTAGWLATDGLPSPSDSQVVTARQPALQAAGAAAGGTAAGSQREVMAWLAAQPGDGPTSVPGLAGLGFTLTGEDVLQSDAGPAARLHYEDASGQRVTLTMRAGGKTGQKDFTLLRDGEASRFVWQDGQMAYSLAGGLGEDKLQRIAEAISQSLRSDQPVSAQAAGDAGNTAAASSPVSPADVPAPTVEKIPLIPVPLPEADVPKET